MSPSPTDVAFTGSIPALYEDYLVPMIFEPYAADLASRLTPRALCDVLEIAAGTGVVTRRLARVLPNPVAIIATDLNEAMLDKAVRIGTIRPVTWQQADAMQLPFADAAFDAVVCQFGVMFFPDKSQAFSEVRRVLRPGGVFLFNVWDRIEENEFAHTVSTALAAFFPNDPPRFMSRTPYAYHDFSSLTGDLHRAGFRAAPDITTLAARSRAASAQHAAIAFCQGTPLRAEIEARDAAQLDAATAAVAQALATRFGAAAIEGSMQAHIVSIEA